MRYTNSTNWSFWGNNMFSEFEVEAIHETSLEILEETGAYIEEEDARKFFEDAGAYVDHDSRIVKIPKWMVEEAIQSAPRSFVLCGRDPAYDFPMEIGRVGYAPVGIAPAIIDIYTGENRPSTKKDLADYAHLVDQLDNYCMCWDCILPTDVPTASVSLHAYEAHVTNNRKHIITTTPDRITSRAVIEMASVVAGGKDALAQRPIISAGSCPKSPLTFSNAVTACVIEFSLANLPVMGMPMVLAGATGPVTLAGALTQHNAEVLVDLTLSQIVRKGTPFWYGSCTSIMDLRKVQCATGCAEHAMFGAAISRMAHFYNVPCVTAGSWTDSKCCDMQAGMEKGISAILPALAGANIIFGAGSFAGGMYVDFASMVAENDMFGEIQFILKGMDINKESLALDVIQDVGPKGEFLTEEHTLNNMRSSQYWPSFFDRDGQDTWEQNGKRTLDDVCCDKAKDLLANRNPAPLSDGIKKQLQEIIADAEKELGIAL